jgi:membrane fusion protein, multidrug efflux system
MRQYASRLLALVLPALMLGCTQPEDEHAGAQAGGTAVSVMQVQAEPVDVFLDLPGRVEAVALAEVRARVDGIVEERLYEEGTDVEAGEALFRIDPREMQAQLSAAEAALNSARANAANAVRDAQRYEELVGRGAISRQDYDTAVARRRTAEAEVSRAEAAVESARLQLSYTEVISPIAGVAGRAEVTVGALVSASAATLLTRVEQFDPVYVDLAQSSTDLLALRAQVAAGELQLPEDKRIEVRLTLENGQDYPHAGYLDFFSMSIDRATGTLALRAQVPNPDRILLPGQFVRTQLRAGVRPDAIRVPQRAVVMDQAGPGLMLVNAEDQAEPRRVELGAMQDGYWVILEGLAPGERVIVEGWDGVRPGQQVLPEPYTAGERADRAPAE